MKLLLLALVCSLTGCSLDTVDDTPILFRHHGGGQAGDADAGVTEPPAGAAGAAGTQAGASALGGAGAGVSGGGAGTPQGGAPSGGAGQGGAPAGSGGLAPTAGEAGGGGLAGTSGGQGGAAGVAGSPINYFAACGNAQGDPGAPLWEPLSGSIPTDAYIAGLPLYGQVQANCGVFYDLGKDQNDRCVWICINAPLCHDYPPDGSVHSTMNNAKAWQTGCDCTATDNTRCCLYSGDSNCSMLPAAN
jgi:hypothetical protein